MFSARKYPYHRTLYRDDVSIPFFSPMRSTAHLVRVSLESVYSAVFDVERELCDVRSAVECPGPSVALWMDMASCMPFSSMAHVCSLASVIEKSLVVFYMRLCVAIEILPATFIFYDGR